MKNKNKRIIQQGAEAIIYLDDNRIIKERTKKSYRIKEIDEKLRKSRTKKEAKILTKIKGIISSPNLIKTNDRDFLDYLIVLNHQYRTFLLNLYRLFLLNLGKILFLLFLLEF